MAAMPDDDQIHQGSQSGLEAPRPTADGNQCDSEPILDRQSDQDDSDSGPRSEKGKGKAKALSTECGLLTLPPELIASIFSYLSPTDLANVSETGRALYEHATADLLWQNLVQDNVPGVRVTSPYPCASFRDLFKAHYPRWFLPRYKIWFSDAGLPGRLVVVQYDQRRGCIEGYQLVATKRSNSFRRWEAVEDHVIISDFDPAIRLHLDQPILRLPVNPPSNQYEFRGPGSTRVVHLRRGSNGTFEADGSGASSSGSNGAGERHEGKGFGNEIPMSLGPLDEMHYSFIYAQRLSAEQVAERLVPRFPYTEPTLPYGDIWPPPVIPAEHRVLGCGLHFSIPHTTAYCPNSRQEVSDRAFRVRKWLELRVSRDDRTPGAIVFNGSLPALPSVIQPPATATTLHVGNNVTITGQHAGPSTASTHHHMGDISALPIAVHIGEDVSTYTTLDPALYTPTPSKPYRGIWVGDYSSHGCEFLWIDQISPGDDYSDLGLSKPSTSRSRSSSNGDAPQQQPAGEDRAREEDAYVSGDRLEAVKLTGDANVPRGEYSWVVEDLGPRGVLAEEAGHEPFEGVKVVRAKGHVASEGFMNDTYIDTQLFLVSHDRLAQYWVDLGHISYYQRVDLDEFLVPK